MREPSWAAARLARDHRRGTDLLPLPDEVVDIAAAKAAAMADKTAALLPGGERERGHDGGLRASPARRANVVANPRCGLGPMPSPTAGLPDYAEVMADDRQ
ncbi:MAG TPA: hypothetical protein VGE95_04660 [Arthrobacter sp.]